MLNPKNAAFLKLQPITIHEGLVQVSPILTDCEEIFAVYKSVRDIVVFTNKRAIAVNVQGMTGEKKDITSMPYKCLQCFSFITESDATKGCGVDLMFVGLGKVSFEFKGSFDIKGFNKLVDNYIN